MSDPDLITTEDLRRQFVNIDFDEMELCLEPAMIVAIGNACGEHRPEFVDPLHPDFQASPAVLGGIMPRRMLPVDFPKLGGIPMDGGKSLIMHAPVRASEQLVGRTHLHEIYDKKGRSGRMVFIVVRTDLYSADATHLATLDSRVVIREKPNHDR